MCDQAYKGHALAYRYVTQKVNDRRLEDCVDLLLTMQNPDGGFASYELVRGSTWLEWLNNSEVFGKSPGRKLFHFSLNDCFCRSNHGRIYVPRVSAKLMALTTEQAL